MDEDPVELISAEVGLLRQLLRISLSIITSINTGPIEMPSDLGQDDVTVWNAFLDYINSGDE